MSVSCTTGELVAFQSDVRAHSPLSVCCCAADWGLTPAARDGLTGSPGVSSYAEGVFLTGMVFHESKDESDPEAAEVAVVSVSNKSSSSGMGWFVSATLRTRSWPPPCMQQQRDEHGDVMCLLENPSKWQSVRS